MASKGEATKQRAIKVCADLMKKRSSGLVSIRQVSLVMGLGESTINKYFRENELHCKAWELLKEENKSDDICRFHYLSIREAFCDQSKVKEVL